MKIDLFDELRWRGLVHQATDERAFRTHLASGCRSIYVGFDPTADSLTIGNLVPIMLLAHAQRAGHRPVVLVGGATGLIGDPSGKTSERQLQSEETVRANVASQRRIFESLLDFSPDRPNPAAIVNNADWLGSLGFIEVLRDVGKHFSVNMMIQKDSVRERLNARDHGISYTEFSYMILQSYDYLHLFRERGVTVQMGGSDQWGNIVAGADLIRRVRAAEGHEQGASDAVHALTAPLVTKTDGGKFGKTEAGAIWLTPERTSPYAYYQFWLNTADADVLRFLKIFTFLDRPAIEHLAGRQEIDPSRRDAQRALAREATAILHGREAMQTAEAAAQALFSGDIAGLDERTLEEVFEGAPSSEHGKASLEGGGVDPVDLLVETGLAKSKRQAREFLESGSVSANGRKLGPSGRLTPGDLLHGRLIALRRGKKTWHVTRWA